MAKLVVVEDESVVAFDLCDLLKLNGHEVLGVFAAGEEALAQIPLLRPDLVLIDIHLSGALDGIDTANALQAGGSTAVLFLTAFADKATVFRAAAQGAYGYIIKPFAERELLAAVEVALFKASADRSFRAREQWVTTTLNSIGDAVIATDASGRVRFVNPVAEELTGWSAQEALAQPLEVVLHLLDAGTRARLELPTVKAIARDEVVQLDTDALLVRRDGSERLINDSAAPTHDETGKLAGTVIVFRDISEKRGLEQKLSITERLASLGTLAAGLAHEVNNPLTYVIANQELVVDKLRELAQESPSSPGLREAIEWMNDAVEGAGRIRSIIADVKVFAHPQRGETLFNLRDALVDAARISQNEVRVRATFELVVPPAPVLVLGDRRLLAQVIGILLVNAAQAIEEGDAGRNRIRLSLSVVGSQALVQVSDTGMGMTPEVMVRIFDPFFTTKALGVGTGLGLSIAHAIAKGHGASLEAESQPGKGTTLSMRLPLQTRATATPRPAAASGDRSLPATRRRLLLVDDDASVLRALQRALGTRHDITCADSGSEALRRLRQGERFDVIISDLLMPEVTGANLHRLLLAEIPEQARRMLFLTGGAFTAASRMFLAEMGDRVLEKPSSPQVIEAAVEALLGKIAADPAA